jgi:hypothetical protein
LLFQVCDLGILCLHRAVEVWRATRATRWHRAVHVALIGPPARRQRRNPAPSAPVADRVVIGTEVPVVKASPPGSRISCPIDRREVFLEVDVELRSGPVDVSYRRIQRHDRLVIDDEVHTVVGDEPIWTLFRQSCNLDSRTSFAGAQDGICACVPKPGGIQGTMCTPNVTKVSEVSRFVGARAWKRNGSLDPPVTSR